MRRFRLTPLRLLAAIVLATLASAGAAYAASLGLSSADLYASSQTLAKGTCSPAESDAEIDASSPNTNFGNPAAATVLSKNSGDSYVLVGFAPAAAPCSLPTTAGADSAVLTFTVNGTFKGPDTVSAYPITSAWNASTVTWNSRPAYSATPDFTFVGTGTHTVTVTSTVDAGIKSGAFQGWMLVDTTGGNNASTVIAGHASAQAPSISLSYEK